MSLKKCFAQARKLNVISALEEMELGTRYEKLMAQATDPATARKQMAVELEAESAHRKRAALLSEAARSRIFDAINGYRNLNGEVDKAEAFVMLHEGQPITEDDLIRALDGRIAHFKIPKKVIFVDNFPRNPAGKILKRELKKRVQ